MDSRVQRRAVRHRRTAERAASYERAVHRERVAARRSRRLRGEEVSDRLRVHAEQTTTDRRPKTRRPSSRTFLGIAVLGALIAVIVLGLARDGRVDPGLVFVAALVTGLLAWLVRYAAHRRRTSRDRHLFH